MIATERRTPLKNLVWTLLILNALDGILTYAGLTFGFITEGNPLLSPLSPSSILMTKFLLSFCLFGLLYTPFVFIQSRFWRYFLIAANTLYSIILLLHFVWLFLLFA